MKAVDTNVLVRFVVADDPSQTQKVVSLFKTTKANRERLFVSAVVILELAWVLSKVYRLSREKVILALFDLLNLSILNIEYRDVIDECLNNAKENTFELSDLLIGYIARANDCVVTLTFDNKASKSPLFSLLKND